MISKLAEEAATKRAEEKRIAAEKSAEEQRIKEEMDKKIIFFGAHKGSYIRNVCKYNPMYIKFVLENLEPEKFGVVQQVFRYFAEKQGINETKPVHCSN